MRMTGSQDSALPGLDWMAIFPLFLSFSLLFGGEAG